MDARPGGTELTRPRAAVRLPLIAPSTFMTTADIDRVGTPSAAGAAADDIPAHVMAEEQVPKPLEPKAIPIPTRTLPLLAVLLAIGSIAFFFCIRTVHDRPSEELMLRSTRPQKSVAYWMKHGYFNSGGMTVRSSAEIPLYFYRSTTGGLLISTFVAEKAYSAVMGRYSWRLQALHNQIVTLFTAALFGLLAFRISTRFGSPPLHALVLGGAIEILLYTFPGSLAEYWELTGRTFFLMFSAIFLLIEERSLERRTRLLVAAQAVATFLLTYMEVMAGMGFIVSYAAIMLILRSHRSVLKRVAMTSILPAVLALLVFTGQRMWVETRHPDIPLQGSTFLFRSGLDGSAAYYVSHLDIAYGRKHARANFPPNQEHLFRWPWMFFAGVTAVLVAVLAAIRGLIPQAAIVSLLSLLGSYLLYAAVFSQAFVIHPYLYDIMIYTPLVFALCVVLPSLVESVTEYRGVAIIAVFFLAIWVSMVQLRDYALWYPPPAETALPR